ncbi:sugar-binding domain-containing protein [Nocardia nova]
MIGAARTATASGGADAGWFSGGLYTYRTTWIPPGPVGNGRIKLRFEGVQGDAELFVNGRLADSIRSGYVDSEHDITELVHDGVPVEIRVVVDDRSHPRSRWYPGSGLFRPVQLMMVPSTCWPR